MPCLKFIKPEMKLGIMLLGCHVGIASKPDAIFAHLCLFGVKRLPSKYDWQYIAVDMSVQLRSVLSIMQAHNRTEILWSLRLETFTSTYLAALFHWLVVHTFSQLCRYTCELWIPWDIPHNFCFRQLLSKPATESRVPPTGRWWAQALAMQFSSCRPKACLGWSCHVHIDQP